MKRNTLFNNNLSQYESFGLEALNAGSGNLNLTTIQSSFNKNSSGTLSAGLYAANLNKDNLTLTSINSQYDKNTANYGYGISMNNFGTGNVLGKNIRQQHHNDDHQN